MSISERLKELREERGLRQTDVASALGMHEQNYARYEQGTRVPRIEQLVAIADFFGVSLDYLAGRIEDPRAPIADSFFRTRLVERRRAMGLTQKQLAEKSGCSESSISRYETGEYLPHIDPSLRIASALDTSLEYLFGDVDDPAEGCLRAPLARYGSDDPPRHP